MIEYHTIFHQVICHWVTLMDSVPAANDQFTELMVGVREGSPAAIHQLVDGYGHHVLRAIRRHLNHRLRNL